MANQLVELSKYLSYLLRHDPAELNLKMDHEGWVSVAELLANASAHGKGLSLEILRRIVTEDNKQRYVFSEDGERIRANQGHSLPVDLKLSPVTPPPLLYHGTAAKNLDSIRVHGLQKRSRIHVHLSESQQTAREVGARYGTPIILAVLAAEMAAAGFVFYRSANNVWLTDCVPAGYIEFPSHEG